MCKLLNFPILNNNSGRITLCQWSSAMESVTNFKLPWRLLKEKLAKVNANNEILYESTLDMIESDDIVSQLFSFWNIYSNIIFYRFLSSQKITANDENLTDKMYTKRENLEGIFRMIDLDSNGLISVDEFKQACEMLSSELNGSWSHFQKLK